MIKDKINILLTNEGQISGFRKLQDLGFIVHHFPMIKTQPIQDSIPFNTDNFEYYIFTSKNSVRHFFSLPFVNSDLFAKPVICIGTKTEEQLNEFNISSEYTAKRNYSENLGLELEKIGIINSKKVMLVQGNLSKNILPDYLKKFCDLTRFVAYKTSLIDSINKDLMPILNIKDLHAVFTSPSGFESFKNLYDPKDIKLISIGNSTSSYIKKCGFLPIITSKMQSYEGISDSIISHFNTIK